MVEYFEIGQIVNTSGLKGEIKVKPFTDDITKFNNFKTIYVSIKKELKEFKIEHVRFSKNMVFLKLKGIDTIEEAENYRNLYLKRKRESLYQMMYELVMRFEHDIRSGKKDIMPKSSREFWVKVFCDKLIDCFAIRLSKGVFVILKLLEVSRILILL